jgi:type VI secretion system protein ImpH
MNGETETTDPGEPAQRSLLARLLREPRRFRFDAAVRVLMRSARATEPEAAMRFRTPPGLVFPPADVLDIRHKGLRPEVTVGLMGLTGPSGVLPRYYSELVSQTLRGGSPALHAFLDMLGERFVGFFAWAAIKYRPARTAEIAAAQDGKPADAISQVLAALTGYGTPHLAPRLASGTDPLLHYAGLFAIRPRSAERLGAMLSDWLGMKVEVIEYAGAWLTLPPDQRTRIGATGLFCRLNLDASAGMRAWAPEARILLRIGPLRRDAFQSLLPDSTTLHRLASLVRAFVGMELGFAVNPVLLGGEIIPLRLDAAALLPPRLGWNTWLPRWAEGFNEATNAGDAVFDADTIERWNAAMASAAARRAA